MKKQYKHGYKITVVLMEHEVDIILQALMDYNYGINAKYDFRKKSITESEALDKFIARNVYESILLEKSKINQEKQENLEMKIA